MAAVVIDCGAHTFKAGPAREKRPKVMQTPASSQGSQGALGTSEFWQELLKGAIGKDHAKGRKLVLGVPLTTSRSAREKLCELAFEDLGAASVCMASTAFLATLGAGLSSALVLDVGEAGACAVPVVEGYPLPHCAAHGLVGGARLSTAMGELITEAGCSLPEGLSRQQAGQRVKEELAYVARDYQEELRSLSGLQAESSRQHTQSTSCELVGNNGSRCIFQARKGEAFRCGELLFRPAEAPTILAAAGLQACDSLHELALTSLRLQGDVNQRGRLLEHVLLVGGASQLPGTEERLLEELRRCSRWVAPGKKSEAVQVHAPQNRDVLAWSGGSLLSECDVMSELSVTREEFKSQGASATVHDFFI